MNVRLQLGLFLSAVLIVLFQNCAPAHKLKAVDYSKITRAQNLMVQQTE